jgi:hypothetical protein
MLHRSLGFDPKSGQVKGYYISICNFDSEGSSWRDRMLVIFTTIYAISAYHTDVVHNIM